MKRFILFALLCYNLTIVAQDTNDSISFKRLLGMDIEQLLNLKVSIATKTEQPYDKAPSVVTVITQQEIQNMGARELYDVLQYVPGFELSKNYYGNVLMGVRGVEDPRFSLKVLLLIDGRPANEICFGSALFYGYQEDINNIERIEIIRGPGSAIYGRFAFSAVINIITKTGKTEKGITAMGEIGTFNTYSGRLAYGYDKNGFDVHINGNMLKSDCSDQFYPGTTDKWSVEQNNQYLDANIGYKGFRFSGSFLNQYMGNRETAAQINKAGNYGLEFQKALTDKLGIKVRFYGQNANRIQEATVAKPNSTIPNGVIFRPVFDEYLYGGEAALTANIFNGNDFSFGIQGDVSAVKNAFIYSNFSFADGSVYPGVGWDNLTKWVPGFIKDNGHKYSNMAVYLQDIWYPIKKLGFTLGARYDYEKQIGGVFNPRLGLVWNVFPKSYFKLLYGSAYRSPVCAQQFAIMGWSLGNENLKPERINTYEAVFSYQFKKMFTQFNFFHNELTDMIYAERYINVDPTKVPIFRNMSKNISNGIEIESKWFISKNIYSFINYSYTKSENTDNLWNGDITYQHIDVAPHKLNAGINISFLKHLNLNANVMYRSKMKKFFNYDAATGSYVDVSQDPVGDYAIINSTLRMVELVKGLEISATVYNLLDTKYYTQEAAILHLPQQGSRQFIVRMSFKI